VNNTTSLEIVEFCIFDDETTEYFKKELQDLHGVTE
jgi:hypothetical protein